MFGALISSAQGGGDTQQQIAEHNQKARQYLQENKPELAIPELQALVALDPNNVEAHGNLGVLLFFKGDCVHAVPELKAATTQRSGLWQIQVLQGLCEMRTGDNKDAKNDIEASLPHLTDKKVRLEAGLELAGLYVNAEDFDKAVPIISALRTENPENPAVLYLAYRVYTEMAGEAMLRLSLVGPNSAEIQHVMGHETFRYGDPAGAIAHYREAIKLNPRIPGIHYELAEVLSESLNPADKAEAEREYKLALEMNPHDEKAQSRLGDIDAEKGNVNAAYADYQKAHALEPGDVEAELGLARMMIQLDQLDKAQPLLEQVLQQEPENDAAHFLLARIFQRQGKKDEAAQQVELYKQSKATKDKLHAVYKQLRISPAHGAAESLQQDGAAKEK